MNKTILQKSWVTFVKEYLLITLGVSLYALGWAMFLTPNNMIGGGVTGFAAILEYAFKLPIPITYFVLNILLLVIGTKILGTGFGAKTIYAIIMTSVMLAVTKELIPVDFVAEFSQDSKIVCTVLGGIMAGVGIGLSMSQGGSTGGTDIIALVWCKFKHASPGKVILIIDIIIILSSLLFPSFDKTGAPMPYPEKIAIVVYGLMQVTVCGYAIDLYISGSKQSVQAFIFSLILWSGASRRLKNISLQTVSPSMKPTAGSGRKSIFSTTAAPITCRSNAPCSKARGSTPSACSITCSTERSRRRNLPRRSTIRNGSMT